MSLKRTPLSRVVLLLGVLAVPGTPAFTATFTVTTEADDNGACEIDDCALREAVLAANALPGRDTIVVPGGTYRLTLTGPGDEDDSLTGDLDVWGPVDIHGDPNEEVVIIGPPNERVFFMVISGVVSHLTITGGNTTTSGGGIWTIGSQLKIQNCTLTENTAAWTGGGLHNDLGTIVMIDSTISHNRASDGGGIFQSTGSMSSPSNITLINTTVSQNSADMGGGISHSGADLRVVSSTIAGNEAPSGSAIFDWGERTAWTNSLIAGECEIASPQFPPTSNGGNMESPGATCFFSGPGDRMKVPDLLLGPLADNGGPTLTHALLPGSPAIDAGTAAGCPATDQRGYQRPADGDLDGMAACDIGAFEANASPPRDIPVLRRAGLLALAVLLAVLGIGVQRRARRARA